MNFLFEPVEPRRCFAERTQDPRQRVWPFCAFLYLAEITREIRVFVSCEQRMWQILDGVDESGGHEPEDNVEGVSRRAEVPMLRSVSHSGASFGFCRRGFQESCSTRLKAKIVKVRPERNPAGQAS